MLPSWVIEQVRLDSSGDESGAWTRDVEAANATAAAADPSVVAFFGPITSSATAISLPVTNRAGLLEVGPSATWPGLTEQGWDTGEPGKYYPTGAVTFARLMPGDAEQAVAAANWSAARGAGPVYVLSDGSLYSDGLARAFARQAEKLGKTVAGQHVIDPHNMNQAAKLIESSGADAIFFAAGSRDNAILAARALNNARLPGGVFSSDTALSDRFLEEAGHAGADWHVVFNGAPELPASPTADRFKSDFLRRYSEPPSQMAGNAYDLANLVLDAVARGAGRDREAVRRSVLSTRQYEGVSGPISFDARGDPAHWAMTGYQVSGGHFEVETLLHDLP
jgi:branched-chain amino acid transport system substrate-binding protein